ncbi:MAG TPA: thioredoxin family protein [Steroidobacteraceae bacterium]|nr:thioredoxin family protein [Steroidobacteraceae bacterium]
MARTPSTMLPLGTHAPAFQLPDFRGRSHALEDFAGSPALLVAFTCNHCPFVKHIRTEFARFASEYGPRGLAIVAINSNDLDAYPQDGPAAMRQEAEEFGYGFPYLLDETQQVAKAYHAACTPDFFLFDGQRRLVYRGQFDDSRPGSDRPVTGADLRGAVDAVLAGREVNPEQMPSLGCNIKWKPGGAPDYSGN